MYQKGEIQMNGKHMENNTKENHPIVVVGVGGCKKDSFQCYALKPKLNKPLFLSSAQLSQNLYHATHA